MLVRHSVPPERGLATWKEGFSGGHALGAGPRLTRAVTLGKPIPSGLHLQNEALWSLLVLHFEEG